MLHRAVVLISFNRPDLTARNLEQIRSVAPTQLFLIADGPRPDHPADNERCSEVRRVLEGVDWACTAHRKFNATNLGCESTVELGLDWVFDTVEEAIILEDDCIPDPSFFRYCDELLTQYADDDRVMHLAGTNLYAPPRYFGTHSYEFSSFGAVWGWATWRRAWRSHREVFPRLHDTPGSGAGMPAPPSRRIPPDVARGGLVTAAGRRYFTEVANSRAGGEFGWDSHWWLSLVSGNHLAVTPAMNLVQNVGFDMDATHTRSSRVLPSAVAMAFPLDHPPAVRLNEDVERHLELFLVQANGRLARSLRKALPPPLRGLARAVGAGRFASWLATTASKLTQAGQRRVRSLSDGWRRRPRRVG